MNLDDHCISVESAEKLVTKRTKAIIPVHLYGNVCDMDKIMAFAKKHNLFVIEDNAEAFGGVVQGQEDRHARPHRRRAASARTRPSPPAAKAAWSPPTTRTWPGQARSFRDHGYDVKERLNLLELEQKLPYIHNTRRLELPHDRDAVGHRPGRAGAHGHLEHAARAGATPTSSWTRSATLPQVKYLPIDTPERQNGWYVLAFSLDIENMSCDIQQFVKAAGAEGAPCWKVFWPQCHTERAFREHNGFGNSGFPFTSKEYTDPASVDYSKVEVPNALWHETHTFTCFAFPTYEPHHCEQIGAALVKVIQAYAK